MSTRVRNFGAITSVAEWNTSFPDSSKILRTNDDFLLMTTSRSSSSDLLSTSNLLKPLFEGLLNAFRVTGRWKAFDSIELPTKKLRNKIPARRLNLIFLKFIAYAIRKTRFSPNKTKGVPAKTKKP